MSTQHYGTRYEYTREDFFQDALIWRSMGFCVMPIGPDKKPLMRWKHLQQRRPTDRQIGNMFRYQRNRHICGLAVICGRISRGLACRDFDTLDGYRAWAAAYPDLADLLPTVRTARGYHVYCRFWREHYEKFDNGELLADSRHYVVLPPSHHPSGVRYEWMSGIPSSIRDFPLLSRAASGFCCFTHTQSEIPNANATESISLQEEPFRDAGPDPHQINKLYCVTGMNVRPSDSLGGRDGSVNDILDLTRPSRQGTRHHCLFRLARRLKGSPTFAHKPASEMEPIVRGWFQRALPYIGTKEYKVTWTDFCYMWERITTPIHTGTSLESSAHKQSALHRAPIGSRTR